MLGVELVRQKHHQMADMNNPSHENLHLNHFLSNFNSIVGSSSPLLIRVVKHLLFWNRFPLKMLSEDRFMAGV